MNYLIVPLISTHHWRSNLLVEFFNLLYGWVHDRFVTRDVREKVRNRHMYFQAGTLCSAGVQDSAPHIVHTLL